MCVFYHAPLYLVKDHFPQTYLEHENMYTAKHDFIIITKTEVEKKKLQCNYVYPFEFIYIKK